MPGARKGVDFKLVYSGMSGDSSTALEVVSHIIAHPHGAAAAS
jgi:hypothetical protein